MPRPGWPPCPAARLSSVEFAEVAALYGFADDHRAFLATVPPVDDNRQHSWPDWRDADPADLRRMLAWPVEGMLFDVECNVVPNRRE
jgi:hypothetical protein